GGRGRPPRAGGAPGRARRRARQPDLADRARRPRAPVRAPLLAQPVPGPRPRPLPEHVDPDLVRHLRPAAADARPGRRAPGAAPGDRRRRSGRRPPGCARARARVRAADARRALAAAGARFAIIRTRPDRLATAGVGWPPVCLDAQPWLRSLTQGGAVLVLLALRSGWTVQAPAEARHVGLISTDEKVALELGAEQAHRRPDRHAVGLRVRVRSFEGAFDRVP